MKLIFKKMKEAAKLRIIRVKIRA